MATLPSTIYDLKECDIHLVDGTAITPITIILFIDEGNVTFEVTRNVEYRKDRDILDSTREGDQAPLSVTFACRFSEITTQTVPPGPEHTISVFEFLTFTGAAAANISTGANVCDTPKAIDITVTRTIVCDPSPDVIYNETITFPEFRYESIGGDFDAGQFNVSGKCNVILPTAIRTAQV